MLVPHNNKVTGKTPFSGVSWYNTAFSDITWTEDSAGSRIKYLGEHSLTPWVMGTWTRDDALSVYYGHLMSDSGTSGTRNNYTPASSTIKLTTSGSFPRCQGFYARFGCVLDDRTETWTGSAGNWTASYTYPTEAAGRGWYSLRFRTCDSNNSQETYWTIKWEKTNQAVLYKSDSDVSLGDKIQELPLGNTNMESGSPSKGHHGYASGEGDAEKNGLLYDVRLIAGLLIIQIGSKDQPAVIKHVVENASGDKVLYIDQLRVEASSMRSLQIAVAPMRFRMTGKIDTREQNLGFTPDPADPPTASVQFAWPDTVVRTDRNPVPSCSATVAPSTTSNLASMELTLTGADDGTYNGDKYSNETTWIRSVSMLFNEQIVSPFGAGVHTFPEDIVVEHRFDFSSLSVQSSATLTFNNTDFMDKLFVGGARHWGEWANYAGAIAVEIELGIEWWLNGVRVSFTGLKRVFTGYANLRSVTTLAPHAQSKYIMHCHSRDIAMHQPKFAFPWMDGWNIYYAAAYLANSSGVKKGVVGDSDLGFREYVPNTPYEDAGSETGDPAYFLPMGSGGSPLFRMQAGGTPWEMLGRIAQKAGYVRYFDYFGVFQFFKFRFMNAATPYRVFDITDNTLLGDNPVPTAAVFSGAVVRDLTQVKNHVTVIGWRQYGEVADSPVSHRVDTGSQYSTQFDPFGDTQPNFIGFQSNLVYIDSMFGEQSFARAAADEIFTVVSSPNINSAIQTWLQPDIEINHRIGINDLRSGMYDRGASAYLEMMVVGVKHHMALSGTPTTTLQTRFVPNGLKGATAYDDADE
jgi:hypothetical protein